MLCLNSLQYISGLSNFFSQKLASSHLREEFLKAQLSDKRELRRPASAKKRSRPLSPSSIRVECELERCCKAANCPC